MLALVAMALMVAALLVLPQLILRLAIGLVFLPFKLLGVVLRIVFGVVGLVFKVLFSGVGLVESTERNRVPDRRLPRRARPQTRSLTAIDLPALSRPLCGSRA